MYYINRNPQPSYDAMFRTYMYPTTPVPEPGTLALVGLGAAGLIARRRKKNLA